MSEIVQCNDDTKYYMTCRANANKCLESVIDLRIHSTSYIAMYLRLQQYIMMMGIYIHSLILVASKITVVLR